MGSPHVKFGTFESELKFGKEEILNFKKIFRCFVGYGIIFSADI